MTESSCVTCHVHFRTTEVCIPGKVYVTNGLQEEGTYVLSFLPSFYS